VVLNSRGETLKGQLSELKVVSAKVHEELTRKLGLVMSDIEENSAALANIQRIALGFVIVAAVLFLFSIQFIFVRNLQKDEVASNRARKETADILRTVNEGCSCSTAT